MSVKVSVLMPTLNVVKYFKKCIESVLNQTLRDIQVIIIDAGSTDGTLQIAEQYVRNDSRVMLIHSEKKSYGYQMNLGIKAAEGEYIGIVETDDYIALDMYEKMYLIASGNGVDFLKEGYTSFIDYNGTELVQKNISERIKSISGKVLDVCSDLSLGNLIFVSIWSGIYSRKFLIDNDIFFNESQGASYQDIGFSLLTGINAKKCMYLSECDYYYRLDNPNSSVKDDNKIFCVKYEFDFLIDWFKKRNLLSDTVESIIDSAKVGSYLWNCKRLSNEGRISFLSVVGSEIKKIEKKIQIKPTYISDDALNRLNELNCFINYKEKEFKKDELSFSDFIEMVSQKRKFVICGAGVRGKSILKYERITGQKFVIGLGDNSKELRGKVIEGYTIESIDDLISLFPNADFLVANKKNSNDIKTQLISCGINENKIYILNESFSLQMLVN
ncbi:Glycosyltransferase involved in cell wall bisynthesis [Lachnospiraceae bacterium]|nr:Glycosyltransferase involved in cell wall bisynthesis [Lachnospiraceae bacterium]